MHRGQNWAMTRPAALGVLTRGQALFPGLHGGLIHPVREAHFINEETEAQRG